MKLKLFVFISTIIFSSCIDSDFSVKYETTLEDNNYIQYFDKVFVEVDIYFGKEKFKSELDLSTYCTVVAGTEVKTKDIKTYDISSSTSFVEKEKFNQYYGSERFYSGILGEETIKLGESESIEKIKIVVVSEFKQKTNIGCYIGLNYGSNQYNIKELNILDQLKNKTAINKRTWYLEFNDFEKGKLVFGKYPHEENGKKFSEKDMHNIDLSKTLIGKYRIDFDNVYYGNSNDYEHRKEMTIHKSAAFSLNTRLIKSTFEFGEYIFNNFFQKKISNNTCFRDFINGKYNFYYCDKSKTNISEMQNLYFNLRDKNVTFILEPKDLFYEHDGYIYFLIIYKSYFEEDGDKDTHWIFGLQFLYKYTLTFNRDDAVMYYYDKTYENAPNNGKENNGNNSWKYIIIIAVLCIVFICCIAFLVYYIKKIRPRKNKANELDEDFEYTSKDNTILDNENNN